MAALATVCVRVSGLAKVVEMSGFERLRGRMEIARVEQLPDGSDADVRVYRCAACQHKMRLTVWAPLA